MQVWASWPCSQMFWRVVRLYASPSDRPYLLSLPEGYPYLGHPSFSPCLSVGSPFRLWMWVSRHVHVASARLLAFWWRCIVKTRACAASRLASSRLDAHDHNNIRGKLVLFMPFPNAHSTRMGSRKLVMFCAFLLRRSPQARAPTETSRLCFSGDG